MKAFSPETAQAIGHYVYALVDPRKRKADPRRFFYVGKGVGQRCFDHAHAEVKWRKPKEEPNPRLQLIRQIRRATGAPPPVQILCHGPSDPEARRIEAIVIKTLNTDGNLCAGVYGSDYCLSVDEVEGRHSNPLSVSEIRSCVLLVSLNGGDEMKPFGEIAQSQLARRTLRYWRVGIEASARVDYVVGVCDQLVRTVFRTKKRDGKTVFRRYYCGRMKNGTKYWKIAFVGERDAALEGLWENRRIIDRNGRTLTRFDWPQIWKLIGPGGTKTARQAA